MCLLSSSVHCQAQSLWLVSEQTSQLQKMVGGAQGFSVLPGAAWRGVMPLAGA